MNVVASVPNIDCLDSDWRCGGVLVGFGLDEMDKVLPSEYFGRDDNGCIDLIRFVDSVDDDVWPNVEIVGIKCVNDDEWWLGEDGEIVISHKSSFFTGENDCWFVLIGEYREISLSPAELHTW